MKKPLVALLVTSLILNACIIGAAVIMGMSGTVIVSQDEVDINNSIAKRLAIDSVNARFDALNAYEMRIELRVDSTVVLDRSEVVLLETKEQADSAFEEFTNESLGSGLLIDSISRELRQLKRGN